MNLIQKIIRKLFPFWQSIGFHITPVHFYEPIPDTRNLKNKIWERNSLMPGVRLNEQGQKSILGSFYKFKEEYSDFFQNKFDIDNGQFGSVDAEALYCMIRHLRPSRIIEIGSGYSTLIMIEAIKKNKIEGKDCQLKSIDPYSKNFIKEQKEDFFSLVDKEVQDVDLSEFNNLRENDILFIDSSHVLKIGSDVQYEYLEILPRLNKGVVVHIHDIFFPYEYPKNWILKEHRFFNEQYILQAFLAFNNHFEVIFSGSYMGFKNPEMLSKLSNFYNKNVLPGSFWMKKIL